jgi:hypothetical protein
MAGGIATPQLKAARAYAKKHFGDYPYLTHEALEEAYVAGQRACKSTPLTSVHVHSPQTRLPMSCPEEVED